MSRKSEVGQHDIHHITQQVLISLKMWIWRHIPNTLHCMKRVPLFFNYHLNLSDVLSHFRMQPSNESLHLFLIMLKHILCCEEDRLLKGTVFQKCMCMCVSACLCVHPCMHVYMHMDCGLILMLGTNILALRTNL